MRFINLKTKAEQACISDPTVLCVGNFDGVHLGHRQLVSSVLTQYEKLKESHKGISTGAWFFDSTSYKLTDEIYSLDEKLDTFASLGLDYAIIADFEEMKGLSPASFVRDILQEQCRCIHAICGENFRFGAKASGNSDTLLQLMNGNATVVPLLSVDKGVNSDEDIVVSSTYIRSLLGDGLICRANSLLDSNYSISEPVIHGKALGRTIGIPTINQNVTSKRLILKTGIYATLCTIEGKRYMGVTNVGTRPTVDNDGHQNVETYIIDFNGDCYDKQVRVEFVARIRDEMKFDSINALKAQIQKDIESAKQIFFHN